MESSGLQRIYVGPFIPVWLPSACEAPLLRWLHFLHASLLRYVPWFWHLQYSVISMLLRHHLDLTEWLPWPPCRDYNSTTHQLAFAALWNHGSALVSLSTWVFHAWEKKKKTVSRGQWCQHCCHLVMEPDPLWPTEAGSTKHAVCVVSGGDIFLGGCFPGVRNPFHLLSWAFSFKMNTYLYKLQP